MVLKTADRIKKLRLDNNISQKILASKLSVSRSSVNAWEMGISQPTSDKIVELAKYFHTTSDYILGFDDRELVDISTLNLDEKDLINRMIFYFNRKNN